MAGSDSNLQTYEQASAFMRGLAEPSSTRQAKIAERVIHIVTSDDFSSIKSDEAADAFIKGAKDTFADLTAREREAAKTGADLTPEETAARLKLRDWLKPGSTFDWASLYPTWKGDSSKFEGRISKALGTAAPEVAAQSPKSQSKVAGVKLSGDGPFVAKDQKKADLANKFIGRGSARSSTARYARDFGPLANTGVYSSQDTVFISAEGARSGRLSPDFAEIRRAMDAGATLVTDSPADRGRTYNYGERQVAEFLGKNGYRESSPGRWIRAQSAAATAASQRQAFAHEREQLLKKEQSPSRVDALAGRVTRMDLDPEGRAAFSARQRAASTMAGLFARGESMVKVLDHPSLADDMAQLITSQLNGSETAASAIRSLQYAADQFNALPVPSHVNQAVMSAATKNEATISSVLKPLRESPDASPISKALAAAVTKVAGGTKVRFDDELGGGTHGMWYGATRDIGLNQRLASTATIVHEATHAATVDAIMRSPELHRAVFNLMDHVLTEKPDLAEAYGMTNSLEFLAEGMSNVHFQQQLKAIKPSSAVAKYLGETAANAWNSFIQLVRNALGLSPEHDSALSQLLDLSGRAMKDTAMNGRAEYGTPLVERRVVPVKDYTSRVNRLVEALAERGAAEEDLGFVSDLLTGLSNGRDVPFGQALAVEVAIRSLPLMKNASVDEVMNNIMRTLIASGLEKDENGKTGALGPLRLPSRLSTQVHNDLRRPGFAATHDSPIRHGGEFNWREHTGKGEGNAAFGAGTYLSTDDTVHSFYKQQFTGMLVNDPRFKGLIGQKALKAVREAQKADGTVADAIDRAIDVLDAAAQEQGAEGILSRKAAEDLRKDRAAYIKAAENVSPTYHVSVDIKPEQLLNWDKPLSEQSSYVKKRLEGELRWTNQKRWSGETSINLTIGTTAFGKPIWAPDDNPTGQYLVASDPLDRYGDTFGTLEEAKKFVAGKATAGSLSGEYIYKGLTQRLGSQAAASDYLQSLGILGHEYAAKDGRNGERPNYVIYDDSKISTNYVRFNAQTANGHVAPSQESIDQAHEYLGKVLGKQIETQFEEITDYNGEWIDHANVVKISTITGVGMLDVARHEALHAFWSKFAENNPKAVEVLKTLTDDPKVVRRLEYLLRDDPAALKQLQDGEERLAYIYQFAMAGALRLPHTPGTTLMAKVRKFLRRVFMMVSDQERAVDLLYAFEHGKMSDPSSAGKAVAAALDQGTWMRQGALKMDAVTQRLAGLVTPAHDLLLNSYSPTARKIGSMFYTSPGRESKDGATGYLNERNQRMRMFDNLFRRAIDGLDPAQMDALRDAMQRETPMEQMRDPDVVAARKELRALFERFHRYMTDEKGLRIGKIRTNYFPVVWDSQAIQADPSKFTGMLVAKYRPTLESMASEWNTAAAKRAARTGQKEPVEVFTAEKVAQSLATLLTRSEGVLERDWSLPQTEDGVLRPWMASGKERTLGFISAEDRAPFLEKNIVTTLSRYFRQGVRTAEYSSRFGRDGVMLRGMLEQAQDEIRDTAARMLKSGDLKDQKAADKWAARQFRNISNATGAMEGSLGAHVSNKVRSLNSAAVVYQNVRLLPLALFSSFVDPLGIIARGGEMRDALRTFADGMKGVTRQWGDMIREEHADRDKSQWEKLAEFAGVIDAATFSHLISDEYGSVYLDGRAKKINEVMFKANGMEAWNRAMRVGATQAAVKFIERHTTSPTEHSERWMENLGFTKDAPAPLDNEGHLITDKRVLMAHDPSLTQEQAEDQIQRVYSGLVRWVEGAVLSPNAAQRPAWGSDPHYSAFWHLKQFAYSFHQTFIRRAMTEAKYGNIMPLGVFAWYIPVMIASDIIKGLALGAGELPAYMKGYDLGDWVLQGVQRGGLLGPYQMGVDALKDPSSLGGPAVEQIFDFMKDPIEKSAVHALPMNALYSRAVL